MFLILEVTGREAAALGAASRAIFTTAGGSIGRRAGNDWVLPDAHVSGRHARVRAIGGTFFLEDNESGNGVVVNGSRLHPNEPFPLKDGDKVVGMGLNTERWPPLHPWLRTEVALRV